MHDAPIDPQLLDVSPPFKLPPGSIEIHIDLPFPPSTNRLHSSRMVGPRRFYRRSGYQKWIHAADALVLLHRSYPKQKLIGEFEATFLFDENAGPHSDLDNRIKATLDWAVSREICPDDRHCRRLVAQWVPHDRAPHGCLLILRSLHG